MIQHHGHQRGYVSCTRGSKGPCGHQACFKYSVVHQHQSEEDCVAWLAAWAEAGKKENNEFTKTHHKVFHPAAARIAELKMEISELELPS